MSRKNLLYLLVSVLLIAVYLGSMGLELLTDYLWFDSQTYLPVFRTIFSAQLLLGLAGGVATGVFLFINLFAALRSVGHPASLLPRELQELPVSQLFTKRNVLLLAGVLSGVIALLAGFATSGSWEKVLMALNGVSFDHADPIFQRDAGFYIFTLPFLDAFRSFFWSNLLLSLFGAGIIYFFKVQSERKGNEQVIRLSDFSKQTRIHMGILTGLILLVLSWGLYLERFTLLHKPSELLTGPGYSDINGTLPILSLKIAAALVSAGIIVFAFYKARLKFLLGAVVLMAVVWIGGNLYTTALQRLVVNPNELEKERQFLGDHIKATNKAFALDRVEVRTLNDETSLSAADIAQNKTTINNVRLWDHEPLLDTFSQIQEIRTYYDFASVDNDRYMINGELRQTMLSPRELNRKSLPSRSWVNEKLTYTHGYGLTLGPVNRVNEQGLPELFVQDLPPRSTAPELNITRPEIYYGEVVDDYVFVKTNTPEFNFPEGDKNNFNTYDGKGGVALGGLFSRILFAMHLRDAKILLADDFTEQTRILLYRNVGERVRKIAPFFRYDQDPYMVIHEGRLVWIFDGYTTSNRFPYSRYIQGVGNYMRNPVKAVIDAYDGTVKFYLSDPSDPIARTYAAIFPELFSPIAQMPKGLKLHLRHPSDYFSIQAHMYATYHMHEVKTFYNKEDQWEVPVVGKKQMEPYYTVMKLPEEKSEEFILMLPFTPRRKDNLAAWMVARSDGAHYGKLVVYVFPKQKFVYGPKQIAARINQDAEVSQQITLWDQAGSNVIRGTLLVIPINSSLLYIQPLYLKAEDGRIPELKRVIVGYQDTISMGVNLEDALGKIFGEGTRSSTTKSKPTVGLKDNRPQTATKAMNHYKALQDASRNGNWERFGQELKNLGETLKKLSAPK